MPDPTIDFEASEVATGLLSFGLLWLALGFGAVSLLRGRSRAVVGEPLVVAAGQPTRTRFLLAMVGLALALGAFGPSGPQLPLLVFAAVLAAGIALQLPAPGGGQIGRGGVRIGWESWSWPEVESWRLQGEFLRVQVDERWLALPLGKEGDAELRRHLEAVLGDRESSWA